ncbi:MAG TPA: polyprenyl diphosphate synthase, partial [Elusimicrobiales bacterium]|nr:polyprenyl diphosphate synthase [Elusimicrobiales bacterium]
MIDQIRKIPKEKFPQHIAIIMDGNRRWAVEKGYPKFYGHKKGIDTVKTVVKAAKKIGVKYLTLYAFSTENWKRSNKEVSTLMALLKQAIKTYTPELLENDVSLKISGRVQEFSAELKKEIDKSVLKLSNCSSMVLNLALNYGGRAEIVDAVNKCLKNGLTEITEKD